MVSIVSMVGHGQLCFGQVDHGQTWSFSNLTMVKHGHYKLFMSDYGQPWSNVKVKILTMVDHGQTWSFSNLTMVDHGPVDHGQAMVSDLGAISKSAVNHGWTMVKSHGLTMVGPWSNHGFLAEVKQPKRNYYNI